MEPSARSVIATPSLRATRAAWRISFQDVAFRGAGRQRPREGRVDVDAIVDAQLNEFSTETRVYQRCLLGEPWMACPAGREPVKARVHGGSGGAGSMRGDGTRITQFSNRTWTRPKVEIGALPLKFSLRLGSKKSTI